MVFAHPGVEDASRPSAEVCRHMVFAHLDAEVGYLSVAVYRLPALVCFLVLLPRVVRLVWVLPALFLPEVPLVPGFLYAYPLDFLLQLPG